MLFIYFRLWWWKMNGDYCNKNQSWKNIGKMMVKIVKEVKGFGAIFLKWKMTIEIQNIIIFKGELRSNYIFLYSTSIGLEYNPIQNNELFFISKLTFQFHLHKIFKAFYLPAWTYFNGVNVGRNILIDSQLKNLFY